MDLYSQPLLGLPKGYLLSVAREPPALMPPTFNVPYPAGLSDEELEKVVDYILTLQ